MSLRPLFHGHEESAFAEVSLPLEVLHRRIAVEISPYRSLTIFRTVSDDQVIPKLVCEELSAAKELVFLSAQFLVRVAHTWPRTSASSLRSWRFLSSRRANALNSIEAHSCLPVLSCSCRCSSFGPPK